MEAPSLQQTAHAQFFTMRLELHFFIKAMKVNGLACVLTIRVLGSRACLLFKC